MLVIHTTERASPYLVGLNRQSFIIKVLVMYKFEEILPLIEKSFGEVCCRKRVRFGNSVSIDFGNKVSHNKSKMADPFYGEWSFSCYHKLWRILKGNKIILEGQNDFVNYEETDSILQQIAFGRLIEVTVINTLNIAMILDNDIRIEFLACSEEEDTFEVLLPHNRCLVYYASQGWEYGRGDLPWPNHLELNHE
ncbi:hypothetical protein AK825_01395 [Psychrobacter sp. P11G5]|nr:hypothetical protein AK825_01395 [Psychrobacter sp. P11G5]